MKRIKRLITIALACTMLLGATMTASAAPRKTYYEVCPSCGHSSGMANYTGDKTSGRVYLTFHCAYCNNVFGAWVTL